MYVSNIFNLILVKLINHVVGLMCLIYKNIPIDDPNLWGYVFSNVIFTIESKVKIGGLMAKNLKKMIRSPM